MNEYDHQPAPRWEPEEENQEHDAFYGTGSTRPPKSRSGLIAAVLIAGIILGSVLSFYGGIQLDQFYRRMNQPDPNVDPSVALEVAESTAPTLFISPETSAPPPLPEDATVELGKTPDSVVTPSQNGGLSLQQIYADSIKSVVSITCTAREGFSSGTGVVLTKDGFLVTNAHVVEGAQVITAIFSDGRSLPAYRVGVDKLSDLAVLYVEAEDLSPARFGDSDALRVGDTVVAIGDPLGVSLRGTMTNGIVSAINRDITVEGRTMTVIQTNAALNAGNSGGPLINCYGQVIGINTMKIGDSITSGSVEGLGFAIPSTTVKTVVEQLIDQGYVSGRPSLGVSLTEVTNLYQYYFNVPAGLYVSEIRSGSPAAAAGLRVKDILLSVDDVRIETEEDLQKLLYERQIGEIVNVVIYRNGIKIRCRLPLQESRG